MNFAKVFKNTIFTEHFWTAVSKGFPADIDVFKMSSGRLTTKPDVVRTSGKRRLIYDVLKTSYLRRPKDVQLTTS